jgi:branched-subunit amino acid transport protein AzlD
MSKPILLAIAALFCTSCLVRIVPALAGFSINEATRRYLERLLPAAVFINFAVYIAYSEAGKNPLAALTSLLFVALMASTEFLGLMLTAVIASGIYLLLIR